MGISLITHFSCHSEKRLCVRAHVTCVYNNDYMFSCFPLQLMRPGRRLWISLGGSNTYSVKSWWVHCVLTCLMPANISPPETVSVICVCICVDLLLCVVKPSTGREIQCPRPCWVRMVSAAWGLGWEWRRPGWEGERQLCFNNNNNNVTFFFYHI